MKYDSQSLSRYKKPKFIILTIVIFLISAIVIFMVYLGYWYQQQLKPISSTSRNITVLIPTGYSTSQIGKLLQEKGVIKNAKAFEWYVRTNDLKENLKAGQYQLDAAKSTPDIARMIATGDIEKNLITITPGQRLDQIKQILIKHGFSPAEAEEALDEANYIGHPALAYKPKNTTLEGYIYPESFQTTYITTPKDIIKLALDQMHASFTKDIVIASDKQGFTQHQTVILASIVEKEVSKPEDRQLVAGIFINRLKAGMTLSSDVTYKYAAAIAGIQPSPFIESLYNTYKHKGLPPGPISNVSKSSLIAVAYPAKHDYLFFVNGDDGKTYPSKTSAEHEALAREHCKVLCSTY